MSELSDSYFVCQLQNYFATETVTFSIVQPAVSVGIAGIASSLCSLCSLRLNCMQVFRDAMIENVSLCFDRCG